MENYAKLLNRLGLRLEEVVDAEPAPTTLAYVNFLISVSALGTLLDFLVLVLPCFWTYMEMADKHKERLEENELYKSWIEVYLSEEYRDIVDRLKRTVDRLWSGDRYEKLKWFS